MSPEDVFGYRMSGGFQHKFVPIVTNEKGEKTMDLRFLQGDLITSNRKTRYVVSQI